MSVTRTKREGKKLAAGGVSVRRERQERQKERELGVMQTRRKPGDVSERVSVSRR